MAIEIKAPAFPESVADGEVASWHKNEGDSVARDELIVEIETDKVVMEVVAPESGTITKIHAQEGETIQSEQLLATLGKQELPLDIVAIKDDQLVGTAALKEHEMEECYPDYRYWMGSIFVAPEYRGQSIARMLALEIISLAKQHSLPQLYLQTIDLSGGLYARLGWEPVDRLNYRGEETLVMVKYLE